MYKGKTVAVVVPAYNEEKLIAKTITTMPDFVDGIIVVNDGSKDSTLAIVTQLQEAQEKIVVVDHAQNKGLGKSLADGYKKSLELEMDVVAVMAGDAQMDPRDLPAILDPIVQFKADYVKGNRLLTKEVSKVMPRYRLLGNALLTLLTKFATGYWHMMDPQCGYTAISKEALSNLDIERFHRGYGYNADILAKLNVLGYWVLDTPVRPIYEDERSGIKLVTYVPNVSWLLTRLFFWRLWQKYLLRDFHPLVFFYLIAIVTLPLSTFLGGWILYLRITANYLSVPTVILFTLLSLFGFQSLLFAMWFDMEYVRGRPTSHASDYWTKNGVRR
jgi:glycosyltransferase involved in cell wall biosynthesis